ncbi:MAG: hypothetical protein HYS13_20385 [Planctomycetia bacterium]|nr:hypothetical protein [Planctomycetia bacterium]
MLNLRRRLHGAAACILAVVAGSSTADDKNDAPKDDTRLKVGGELPFVVVDFALGPHGKGAGCPSVMIKNHKARGIVVWAQAPDEAVFTLAKALEGQLDETRKIEGYLVAFEMDVGELTAPAKKHGIERFTVGSSRSSGREDFKSVVPDAKAACTVILVDKAQIKAIWSLRAEELTKEKTEEVVKEAAKLLEPGEKK